MATNVSPGVYTKIIDLSAFVQAAPSTIGFITAITEKGEDNVLKFVGSRSDLISEFGEPNISTYGKNYGQGLYCAYNYLGESGALYFLRVLPDDAAFANLRIDALFGTTDTTASFQITSVSSVNTKAELKTNLADVPPTQHPLCFLYPIGRGQYYNKLAVRLTEIANPLLDGVYVLDLYEKQSDGDDVIIESFQISFDPTSRDLAGDSLFITDVLAMYSTVLRAEMQLVSDAYSVGYYKVIHIYDKNIGTVTIDLTSGSSEITDNKQDFGAWDKDPATGYANYTVIAKDAKGVEIWGWLGSSTGYIDGEGCQVFNNRDLNTATQVWNGNITDFDVNSEITYTVKQAYGSVADAFTSAEPVPLKKGSDGSLLDSVGNLDTAEATTLLAQGYAGIIDDQVLDTENIYYTMVFDCGYPTDVKTQISTLVQTRRDCVGLLDNGDNSSVNNALAKRNTDHTFNTYFLALYECYNKVFDTFTGQDVWFSPIYHISYLAPRNDSVAEPWFAIAGFNRAAIDTIKDLRFNPRLGQRDQLYRKQINPIVKFNPGYVVWGQLTTQAKPSALQDLNIVRLVLYIKRAFEDFCKFFIFEQNDEITWGQVSSQLVAFLENIKGRRGLYSYSVEVGASDYEKKTKKFHINVILQPTRVVEQIELNFFIQ
jgi:hypothetical protein